MSVGHVGDERLQLLDALQAGQVGVAVVALLAAAALRRHGLQAGRVRVVTIGTSTLHRKRNLSIHCIRLAIASGSSRYVDTAPH